MARHRDATSRRAPPATRSARASARCARRWASRCATWPSAAASARRCSRRSSAARRARRSPSPRKIAAGLELTLSQLLRLDEGQHVVVSRAGERRQRRARRAPVRGADPAAAGPARRRLRCTRWSPAPRPAGRGDPPMHEPGSRETAVVLDGDAWRWSSTASRHELREGDSVTFDADLPHHFENEGERADPRSSP